MICYRILNKRDDEDVWLEMGKRSEAEDDDIEDDVNLVGVTLIYVDYEFHFLQPKISTFSSSQPGRTPCV